MSDFENHIGTLYHWHGYAVSEAAQLEKLIKQSANPPDGALSALNDAEKWEGRLKDAINFMDALKAERDKLAKQVEDQKQVILEELMEANRLREALGKLVVKLDAVFDSDEYISVFSVSRMHVGPYKGPTCEPELKEARHLVKGC